MGIQKDKYVEDLGWPFTSNKYARACPLCGKGCVFGDIDIVLDGPSAAHKVCIDKWKEENDNKEAKVDVNRPVD